MNDDAVGEELPPDGAVSIELQKLQDMAEEELVRWAEEELGIFLNPNTSKGAMLVRLYALGVPE